MALQQCRAAVPRTGTALRLATRSYSASPASLDSRPRSDASSLSATRHNAPYSTATTTMSSPPSSSASVPTTHSSASSQVSEQQQRPPRWSYTPPDMQAPVRMDWAKNARNKIWPVNNDPARLDEMYNRLLGPGGARMLPEEVKWLAVTHKSFDQGRRGFNDRLALMGRMVLHMEAAKYILSLPPMDGARKQDDHGREPFEHEQLTPVDNLGVVSPIQVFNRDALYRLGMQVGLLDVLRWKPRLPENLESSGVDTVIPGAIMAIVGAINLQHGSEVAAQAVREKILSRVTGQAAQ